MSVITGQSPGIISPAESVVIALVPEDSLILVANYFSQSNPKLACFVADPGWKTASSGGLNDKSTMMNTRIFKMTIRLNTVSLIKMLQTKDAMEKIKSLSAGCMARCFAGGHA